mgnify:CR=1 FL=1|tara:strand:- start:220 stop:726 length:507 start_codon:yes stop_codon:yes gene_type:complete
MKYKVLDNFLDDKYFDSLVTLFTDKTKKGNTRMSWFFQSSISNTGVVEDNLFYMTHMIYERNVPKSSHYEILLPLIKKLDGKCLIRIKANLYPNTETLHEHKLHFDYPYSHFGAILSLNTCDGYTKLEDGTKINSVANRLLLFDPSEEHCSTTTTNVSARINININYL